MVCSSELNKCQWPRLEAACLGVSSSEEQQVGGEGLVFRALQLQSQNKREQYPAFAWGIIHEQQNERSALSEAELKACRGRVTGESFVLAVVPRPCREAFC